MDIAVDVALIRTPVSNWTLCESLLPPPLFFLKLHIHHRGPGIFPCPLKKKKKNKFLSGVESLYQLKRNDSHSKMGRAGWSVSNLF